MLSLLSHCTNWCHCYFFKAPNQEIVIEILDRNDNSPVFLQSSYVVSIPEMMSIGSSVIAVTATDSDATSLLKYSILQSSNFYVDSIYSSNTGVVRVNQVLCLNSSGIFIQR